MQIVDTRKYKNVSLIIHFDTPYTLKKKAALHCLSQFLGENSRKYPDKRSMTRKRDMLYGAELNSGIKVFSDVLSFQVNASFLNPRFVPYLALEECVSFFEEVIDHVLFEEKTFEEYRRNVIDSIHRRLDHPSRFSLNETIKLLAKHDERMKVYDLDILKELETLRMQDVAEVYEDLLQNAFRHVTLAGDLRNIDPGLFAVFENPGKDIELHPKAGSVFPYEETESERTADQSYLLQVYATPYHYDHPDYYAFLLGNALFGIVPTSLLFTEVREKRSLCYNISSFDYKIDGYVFVKADIDASSREASASEIARQFGRMRAGDFSEEDLMMAKSLFINSVYSIQDDLSALSDFDHLNTLLHRNITMEDYASKISAVTKEEIARVYSSYAPVLTYFQKGVSMKITDPLFEETYLKETLDNGLHVVIFHRPEYAMTTCAFGTPFGALDIDQKVGEETLHFTPGLAHFLEHKLFESTGRDMMALFSALGASVNAFTSYKETVYYFSKSGGDIEEPLDLLLDFVQELSISEESVEKEKGIIDQELAMYETSPDSRLLNETFRCLYHEFPLKYDIGGDREGIRMITKEELEKCYGINYRPSNMLLVITTPEDPERILELVKENQSRKSEQPKECPIRIDYREPEAVVREEHSFSMDVNKKKQVFAYKFQPDYHDPKGAFYAEWCSRFLLEAHFSPLNPAYEDWLEEGLINDFFGFEVEFEEDYAHILFYIENDDETVLKRLVEDSLKEDLLTGDLLTQLKRRYIGSAFSVFDEPEGFTIGYIRDALNGIDFLESFGILQAIGLDDVRKVWNSLDFSHHSLVTMRQK